MTQWQPQSDRRGNPSQPPAVPPQFAQQAPWSQQHQQRQAARRPAARFTSLQGAALFAAGVVVTAVAGGAFYLLGGRHASSPVAATAAGTQAEPETEAGVRAAATAFYDLYSAGQWDQAWAYLTPAAQKAIPRATWTGEHTGCPPTSAGLAREIKGVTMAGSTAVVKETVAGALSKLGTGSDSWSYSGSRWGLTFSASDLALYKHGSVKADIAAAKKAGYCAAG